MRTHGGVLLVLSVAACLECGPSSSGGTGGDTEAEATDGGSTGGDPAGELPWRSGSRVRARVAVAPDGFRVVVGWHDRDLDIDCDAVDFVACGAFLAENGDTLFADPECTLQLVQIVAFAPSQGYAQRTEDDGTHLYRVGTDPLPTGPSGGAEYFVKDPSGCIPNGGLEDLLFPVIEELPADTLATWHIAPGFGEGDDALATDDGALMARTLANAQQAIDDSTTRLRLVLDRRDDLGGLVGVHDSARDQACEPTSTTTGLRCVPPQTLQYVLPMFTDAACQNAVDASPEPGIYHVRSNDGVEQVLAYDTPTAPLYWNATGRCALQTASYTPTDIPLGSLEALELDTE